MRRVEPPGGALHIERRYFTLCFWSFRNYHNRTEDKNIAWVTATGRSIYSPQCAGGTCCLYAHFTGVLYSPAWVFTLSVFLIGCGRPRTTNGQKLSTRVFCMQPMTTKNLSDFGCLADDILGAHWQRNCNQVIARQNSVQAIVLAKVSKQTKWDINYSGVLVKVSAIQRDTKKVKAF